MCHQKPHCANSWNGNTAPRCVQSHPSFNKEFDVLSQKLMIKFANKYKFEILNSLEKIMLLVFPWSGASCRRGFCGRSGLGPPGRGLVAPWSVAVCCPPGVPDSEGPFVTFAPRPCAAVGTSARNPIESHGTPRGLPGLRGPSPPGHPPPQRGEKPECGPRAAQALRRLRRCYSG